MNLNNKIKFIDRQINEWCVCVCMSDLADRALAFKPILRKCANDFYFNFWPNFLSLWFYSVLVIRVVSRRRIWTIVHIKMIASSEIYRWCETIILVKSRNSHTNTTINAYIYSHVIRITSVDTNTSIESIEMCTEVKWRWMIFWRFTYSMKNTIVCVRSVKKTNGFICFLH